VREVGLGDGFAQFFGAIDVASGLDLRFVFPPDPFRVEIGAEFLGAVIPVFLQLMNLAGQAAENGDGTGVFFGIAGELLLGLRSEEEFGDVSGGELQANLGKLAGVAFAEKFEEIVLAEVCLESALLFHAPLLVTTASLPVGNIAGSDVNLVFLEGIDDFGMSEIIPQHAIDHVAFEIRQPGNFAVACEFPGRLRRR